MSGTEATIYNFLATSPLVENLAAPIAILLSAGIAAAFAKYSIEKQRQIAREKNCLDFEHHYKFNEQIQQDSQVTFRIMFCLSYTKDRTRTHASLSTSSSFP